jgi:glyoxylase-like metal-dependent hydrolase (beta-lactamase superfamily II)
MIHEVLTVGMLGCNCSILGDEESGEAVVIDPGDEAERIEEALAKHKLRVKYIVATHAHLDHVGALGQLQRATGAPVLMHEADLPLYEQLPRQAEWMGMDPPCMGHVDRFLKDGDTVRFGRHELEVLHTPGHSPGSISLRLGGEQGRLFSGDTLFQGGIGRADLWGGNYEELLQSIHQRLLVFPDETPVFPGHGPSTLIGEERVSNPFLQEGF